MTGRPEPLDVLAFIGAGMSMTSEQIASRWPEWSRMKDAALARFERECLAHRLKWGSDRTGTSDPMVDSVAAARHHWVYLPLIRAALAAHREDASRPQDS